MKWKPLNQDNLWYYIGMTYLAVMGVWGTIDLFKRLYAYFT